MESIAANGVPIFRETIARYRVVASRKKKTKRNRSVGVGTENTDPGVAGRFEIENTNADQWPSRRRAGPSAPTSGRRRGGGAKAGAGRGLGRRGEGRQLLRRSAQKLPVDGDVRTCVGHFLRRCFFLLLFCFVFLFLSLDFSVIRSKEAKFGLAMSERQHSAEGYAFWKPAAGHQYDPYDTSAILHQHLGKKWTTILSASVKNQQ